MSQSHAATGDVVSLPNLLERVETHHSRALVKSDHFEAMVVQIAKGKTMDTRNAPAPLIAQGLSGTVRFTVNGETKDVSAGDWMYIDQGAPESVEALDDCAFLLTVLFVK